jgi:4'-phosphopantetheinyl transferase
MNIAWPPSTEPIALSADRLDVWAVRLEQGRALSDKLAPTLSAAERERATQFRLEEPRQRFMITRAALRMVLGKYLGRSAGGVTLENDPQGKPRLASGHDADDVHFNVAHSAGLALIAVTADCEVGVDVERVRAVSHADHIARRYFHPAELLAILSAAPSARDTKFLRCWTGKEAVLKAIGSGVTGSLASFRVPTYQFTTAWIDLPASLTKNHPRCWLHELAPCPGYVGAVACLGEERPVRHFALEL